MRECYLLYALTTLPSGKWPPLDWRLCVPLRRSAASRIKPRLSGLIVCNLVTILTELSWPRAHHWRLWAFTEIYETPPIAIHLPTCHWECNYMTLQTCAFIKINIKKFVSLHPQAAVYFVYPWSLLWWRYVKFALSLVLYVGTESLLDLQLIFFGKYCDVKLSWIPPGS
jgi:hypothetical protein